MRIRAVCQAAGCPVDSRGDVVLNIGAESTNVKRSVLREDVKSFVIDAIMRGSYKIGERLVETQVARDLDISQAPVREAFRDLEQIGILRTVPYKGAYVNGYSSKELKDAYDVRAELESLAIRQALPAITDRQLEALAEIYEEMKKESDIKIQVALDVKFHESIVDASNNKILKSAWSAVSIASWTFYGFYNFSQINMVPRHELILSALQERDAQKADDYIRLHFHELKDYL